MLFVCEWPQNRPSQYIMGKPVEVWCRNLCAGINPFVPIENIKSSVIIAFDCLEEEVILIVIPVVHNVM